MDANASALQALLPARALTAGCAALLEEAVLLAQRKGHSQVASEHLLMALFGSPRLRTSTSYNWLVHMAGVVPEVR